MPSASVVVGRLAPTPSGHLHLGNVCAFAAAWLSARARDGRVLLRIEDVDRQRSRLDVEHGQRRDLAWLGFDWDDETPRQSERDYGDALARLAARGSTYYCQCTRAEVRRSGGVYAGTCRDRGLASGALRFRLPAGEVLVRDRRFGERHEQPASFGDPVLQRRDGTVSYNLAVVVDDIRDGVNEVARGADLLGFTAVQITLWRAFDAAQPAWLHAPLVLGPDREKLSKSHGSMHLAAMREAGWRAADIWRLVLPWIGVPRTDSLGAAMKLFDPERGPRGPIELEYDETVACPAPGSVVWRTAA